MPREATRRMPQAPSSQTALQHLPGPRLIDLGRDLQVSLPPRLDKDRQIALLLRTTRLSFTDLLQRLGRDELKALCRAYGLDDSGRARQQLAARLLAARGLEDGVESTPPTGLFAGTEATRHMPQAGDIVRCRHRQWLVEEVVPPGETSELAGDATAESLAHGAEQQTRVRLVCLDDDHQGQSLEVLWELELGARLHRPEAHGLGDGQPLTQLDPPRHFAAYLHAIKWNTVTATDGRLFQAPFRAGIHLFHHQLTPLKKALSLPRANLFIADDVGLGKTIEAGLVLSELWLRQRVNFGLIVCPSSVALQWRDEMQQRFGLSFEVMSRELVAERRKQRGFGCNPWTTHHRFIISHQLLRRPEYRDPLLAMLGARRHKSLLILDEAHIAAPASHSKYAVDSQITKVVRDVAPRFENRLFLSATPHNGHSNSFSSLLELLDPQRFTRGVAVQGRKELAPIMVRRLKQDLRALGSDTRFPLRRVLQLNLEHRAGQLYLHERSWDPEQGSYSSAGEAQDLGPAEPFELSLAQGLAEYTALSCPTRGQGRLVFINLQKRLLSSVEAFSRTLNIHAQSMQRAQASAGAGTRKGKRSSWPAPDSVKVAQTMLPPGGARNDNQDDSELGQSDDALDAQDELTAAASSRALGDPDARAIALLLQLQKQAQQYRNLPDAKVRALVAWMQEHQCGAVQLARSTTPPPSARGKRGGSSASGDNQWTERRLIIFTEYGDTKRYLLQQLTAAISGTDQAEERVLQFHGGMGEDQRAEVQRAFNGDPAMYPVRVLIATDAAREGLNLQAHCADLVHWDVPWNPARMEQRNGRIDRTLQPAPEVRCHYFTYAGRAEDPVLSRLVEKTETIKRELGSLSAVVMDRIGERLEVEGLSDASASAIEALSSADGAGALPAASGARSGKAGKAAQQAGGRLGTVQEELEDTRRDLARLRSDLEDAGQILNASKERLEFEPALLRDALNVGFELAGAGNLTPCPEQPDAYLLPGLPLSWQRTLDTLRPPLERDEPLWEWRKRPPRPVVFEPQASLTTDTVQLHLQHPLVQRVLARFLSQGFSTADLSRVTLVRSKQDALVRVIAFGRLSLFGPGATRLHDEVISVAARWYEGDDKPLKPFAEKADRRAIEQLEDTLAKSPSRKGLSKTIQRRVLQAAPQLFAELWDPIREEADARAVAAEQRLKARGRSEADALRELLKEQRKSLNAALKSSEQLAMDFGNASTQDLKAQRKQLEADRKHMQARLEGLAGEIAREPGQIEAMYQVVLPRLSPVGLVVLWPEGRS